MATENVLKLVYTEIAGIRAKFRERVCKECNWSRPTYYRKMRDDNFPLTPSPGRILSNAERDKITSIRVEIYTELFNKYVNKGKKGRIYISK